MIKLSKGTKVDKNSGIMLLKNNSNIKKTYRNCIKL